MMIDETNGLGSAYVTEQLLRQNSVNETGPSGASDSSQESTQNQQTQVTDTVTLSAEAVALNNGAQPANEANEVEQQRPVEQSTEPAAVQQEQSQESRRTGTIDIRV